MLASIANKSLISFKIPAWGSQSLVPLRVSLTEHLSDSDSLEFSLQGRDGLPLDTLPGSLITLSWETGRQVQYYHALVKSVKVEAVTQNQSIYHFTASSPLYVLDCSLRSRHFIYKNLQTIVKELLKGSEAQFLNLEFHLQGEDPDRSFTGQHDESDLSFLERILHEVGWSYGLVHQDKGVVIHIYDNSQSFPQIKTPLPFEPLDQGTKSQDSIYELYQKQDQTESMLAVTDCKNLRAGQVFRLIDHPQSSLNQAYLITQVTQDIDETSSKLRWKAQACLLPLGAQFKPHYSQAAAAIQTIEMAQIFSESEAPLLTEDGDYILKSLHTEELTHPVRLTTPYAGADYGWHFPLHNETQVLVAYLNGHPDQPIMLGALFNQGQTNVVTDRNPRQNQWITQSGHRYLMDDEPGHQKILIHTAKEEQSLCLDAKTGDEKVQLISETGQFKARISQGSEFKTELNHALQAGASIKMTAKEDAFFTSEETDLQMEAAQDVKHLAGQDLSLHAERDLKIRVDGRSQTQVRGDLRTEITGGSQTLRLAAGQLSHTAKSNLQFTTQSGDLVLQTARAKLSLMANGDLIMEGANLILQAPNIDINNSGQTQEN